MVLNRNELVEEHKIWYAAEERIERAVMPPVNVIVHSIDYVSNALALGQYFFKDIKKEGIHLYNSGTHELKEPGNMSAEEATQIAEGYFKQWYTSSLEAFDSHTDARKRGNLNWAVFSLHQATERYCVTLLLVFTNYKPRTHNLRNLASLIASCDEKFIDVFPQDTKFRRRCFELLRKSYIDARYSEHYKINEEEINWLAERVVVLQKLTKEIYEEKINNYKNQ